MIDCPEIKDVRLLNVDSVAEVAYVKKNRIDWGMNVISSSAKGMSSKQMKINLNKMKTFGASTAVFVPVFYQATLDSSEIFFKDNSPSDEALLEIILYAKSIGLKTAIKPHLNVESKESRNKIKPKNYSSWMIKYSNFILHYAKIASKTDVDLFFVGTELEGVSSDENSWRKLISKVRSVYKGRVTYSSNRLGEAFAIKWWNDLDYIGISFYEPLVYKRNEVSISDLVLAWHNNGYVWRLLKLYQQWHKPIVLGEIGYYSRQDTANNPAVISNGAIDEVAQAVAYSSAYRVLSSLPQIEAFYIWALDASGTSSLGGYSIIPSNNTVMCELMKF